MLGFVLLALTPVHRFHLASLHRLQVYGTPFKPLVPLFVTVTETVDLGTDDLHVFLCVRTAVGVQVAFHAFPQPFALLQLLGERHTTFPATFADPSQPGKPPPRWFDRTRPSCLPNSAQPLRISYL
jgi:hypothetical protein